MNSDKDARVVVTMNGGSSSLKFSVTTAAGAPRRLLRGVVSSIGAEGATLSLERVGGEMESQAVPGIDYPEAARIVLSQLGPYGGPGRIAVVGHRIVHGGPNHDGATRVTPKLLEELRALASLDPNHLPAELAIVESTTARAPSVPQVACFDTAFHRTMPRVARMLALPRRYETFGVRRYGFHGLSFTFLMEELARVAGDTAARGRVVLAHLGAGASLAAVRDGMCVDTTMAFTPTSGVMMATRSGDLDPGLLVWLLRHERLTVDALDDLVNHRAGLLGVSETTGDMRTLLACESNDPRAQEAVALFCYQVRKAIGALATAIGGLDTLVFSGGIGEKASVIRARVGQSMEHLGIAIDERSNASSAPVISPDSSACVVRVIATDEESIIAREALSVVAESATSRQGAN